MEGSQGRFLESMVNVPGEMSAAAGDLGSCGRQDPAPVSRDTQTIGAHPSPHSLHSCHQKCGRKSSLHFPGDVFATPERAGGGPAQGPLPYLDDDIPLLNVEEEPGKRWRRPDPGEAWGCFCQGSDSGQDGLRKG